MTHEYYIKHTTRNISTGLISDIRFDVVSRIGDDAYTGKYECNTPGSADDGGFIAYNSLSSSDLLGFINKYGDGDDPTNGLNLYQTINSSSFADELRTPTTINDLPPSVGSGKITV
tara:strand:+ start:229 stop:576 length:348 start_codon:yes stop_codon:yes gene_type:complete